jgi:hypothetical protein
MAIKKMRVSFVIPIEQFLGMVAASNTDMHIDIFGDDRPARTKALNGHAPKLLEAPRKANRGTDPKSGERVTGASLIAAHMIKHKDRGVALKELGPILAAAGLKEKSVSPQIAVLQQRGHAKRLRAGVYQITAKGVHAHDQG